MRVYAKTTPNECLSQEFAKLQRQGARQRFRIYRSELHQIDHHLMLKTRTFTQMPRKPALMILLQSYVSEAMVLGTGGGKVVAGGIVSALRCPSRSFPRAWHILRVVDNRLMFLPLSPITNVARLHAATERDSCQTCLRRTTSGKKLQQQE